MIRFAWTVIILGVSVNGAQFPNDWKACKMDKNHNECLRSAIQQAVPDLVKGIPKLGVPPIDPLRFNRIAIDQKNRPVSLNLELLDMDIKGITEVKIDSVRNDWKTMVINVSAPVLKCNSQYKIDGKVLVLPIQGEGDCTINMDAFTAVITIKFDETKSGPKTYYRVKNLNVDFDTQRMWFHFENLFNGNKQLGDQLNIFINENWKEIFMEIKPAVEAALQQATTEIASRFFTKVPKNEITPK